MAVSKFYPFVLVLKNESSAFVNIIGLLLSFGSAVFFLREMISAGRIIVPLLAGIIFISGILLWNIYNYYYRNNRIFYSKALLIAGLVWTRMPYMEWLVVVFALLAVLEYQAKLSPEIGFAEDHIVLNNLLKKKYSWSSVDNVILKDGLLTIDFKNNKLLQKEIESDDYEASEQEFNEWVSKRLIKTD